MANAEEVVDAEGETSIMEDSTFNEADDLSDYPADPITNMVTANADGAHGRDVPPYGNPMSPQTMPLPHADPPHMFQLHPSGHGSTGLTLPQEGTYYQPYISPTAVSVSPYTTTAHAEPSTGNVQAMEARISPHLTLHNTKPKSLSERGHKSQTSFAGARKSRAKRHKKKPSDGGSLQLPSLSHAPKSASMSHSEAAHRATNNVGSYQSYPEMGRPSGANSTSNDASSRISYDPHSYNKNKGTARTYSPLSDQRQPEMTPSRQFSDRLPSGSRATPSFGNNTLGARQNSPYMRQNTPRGLQSRMEMRSPPQRRQETQSPATSQQHASYGSYSYVQSHQQNQGAPAWYGSNNANDQGAGQQNPNYSWGMQQEGWSKIQ